jgi:hypothetical protein
VVADAVVPLFFSSSSLALSFCLVESQATATPLLFLLLLPPFLVLLFVAAVAAARHLQEMSLQCRTSMSGTEKSTHCLGRLAHADFVKCSSSRKRYDDAYLLAAGNAFGSAQDWSPFKKAQRGELKLGERNEQNRTTSSKSKAR